MRKITVLALIHFCLLFTTTPVLGKCASRSARVWPPAGRIPPDCHILVEGYGDYKDVVATAESRTPRLISEGHEVDLELVEHYIGDMKVAQVLLRPMEKLRNGNKYWLTIEGIEEGFTYYDGYGNNRRRKRQEWLVADPSDKDSPVWRAEPEIVNSRRKEYGCGPAVEVDLSIKMAKRKPVMALVQLYPAGFNTQKSIYIIPVEKGKVTIGHGMCSGPFIFTKGVAYTADLILIDRSGNRSARRKLGKTFQAP